MNADAVLAIYEKHGKRPELFTLSGEGCCLIGILYLDKFGSPPLNGSVHAAKKLGFGDAETISGFDASHRDAPQAGGSDTYNWAWSIGHEIVKRGKMWGCGRPINSDGTFQ